VSESQGLRPEIQGVRAIVVLAVVLFHIWPDRFPGGYVGVDVFFVISGFLITSLLVRELDRDGGVDFGAFYLKRMRRLLPMAGVVLAATALLVPLLLPASAWKETSLEVIASALYVENWRLAARAVDYLAAEEAPGPVQHYWSLSIEEQFYLLWPALLVATAWLARRAGMPLRRCLALALAAVVLASFVLSVLLTDSDPARAYFATHVRVWELGAGALLALAAFRSRQWVHDLAGLAGLACIVVAVLAFGAGTAFPGHAALLPVAGAALVIFAGNSGPRFSAGALLSLRPLRWTGDASYSIYLWHWPMIVFFLAWKGGGGLGAWEGAMLMAATLGMSWLSKAQVEDRFRQHGPMAVGRVRPGLRIAGAALLPVLLVAAVPLGLVMHEQAKAQRQREIHPGARVLATGVGVATDPSGAYTPALALLKEDRAAAYDNGCHLRYQDSEPVACRYGDAAGTFKVFLIGDSHAANWIPAFEEVARQKGWNASSYTKSSCPLIPVMLRRDGRPYAECLEWGRRVRRIIAEERPDLVILAQMYSVRAWPVEGEKPSTTTRNAIIALWREILDEGSQVVAIADTPRWRDRSPDRCLAEDRRCQVGLAEVAVAKRDPLFAARRKEKRVALLDFTDLVCPRHTCPVVVGNVIVWRDRHHLTATYSRSMAGFFGQRIDQALDRGGPVASNEGKKNDGYGTRR